MDGFSITKQGDQCLWLSFSREMLSSDLQHIAKALADAMDGTVCQLIVDRRNQETSISVGEAQAFGKQIGSIFAQSSIRVALLEQKRQVIDDIIANQVFMADVEMATFDNEFDARNWLDS